MTEKTILCGMNNPYGSDPKYALYPAPERCAGWNLWQILAYYAQLNYGEKIWRMDYAECFDRRNLLTGSTWSKKEARAAAADATSAFKGRRVIILGVQPAEALGLPRTVLGQWHDIQVHHDPASLFSDEIGFSLGAEPVADKFSYTCLPHPSGRCREYNLENTRTVAGRVLYDEYKRYDRNS
jgi:hypothetical protein